MHFVMGTGISRGPVVRCRISGPGRGSLPGLGTRLAGDCGGCGGRSAGSLDGYALAWGSERERELWLVPVRCRGGCDRAGYGEALWCRYTVAFGV